MAFDLIVIGTGPVGMAFLWRIMQNGADLKICVIDSENSDKPEFCSQFVDDTYAGATAAGRYVGLGGGGNVWGGASIPYSDEEIDGWCVEEGDSIIECRRECELAAQFLRLPVEARNCRDDKFVKNYVSLTLANCRWPHFWNRNPARVHKKILKSSRVVFVTGTVVNIKNHGASKAVVIDDGSVIRAKRVVLAAGAIQSARIILQSEADEGVKPITSMLFHDHISFQLGSVAKNAAELIEREFGWRLSFFGMEMSRLEISGGIVGEKLSGFVHFPVSRTSDDLFSRVRKFAQYFQSKTSEPDLISLIRNLLSWKLVLFIYFSVSRRRLCFSVEQSYEANVVLTQSEQCWGRIFNDASGKFTIDWRRDSGFDSKVLPLIRESVQDWFYLRTNSRDLFHNNGTEIRMRGEEIFHPVGIFRNKYYDHLTKDSMLKAYRNIYILGTACIPDCGSVNPTFHSVMHSIYLSDVIGKQQW